MPEKKHQKCDESGETARVRDKGKKRKRKGKCDNHGTAAKRHMSPSTLKGLRVKLLCSALPPPFMSELLRSLNLEGKRLLFIELYCGGGGGSQGALAIAPDFLSLGVDCSHATLALYKAALPADGHETRPLVLGPENWSCPLDKADGRGEQTYNGCGEQTIKKTINKWICETREKHGLQPGSYHIHLHARDPRVPGFRAGPLGRGFSIG